MKYLIAFALLFAAADAFACSCMRMTREQTIARSDLVVRGTIEEVRLASEMYGTVVARVRVLERIKGVAPETITVVTAGQSAACGIKLAQGGNARTGAG